MNFLPRPVPTPRPTARAGATVPETAKRPAADTRASGPVPAAASAPGLRAALEKFEDGATVNVCDLLEKGILSKCEYGYKVLGNGNLTKKLTVRASAFSASAKEKIVAAGGKYEVV